MKWLWQPMQNKAFQIKILSIASLKNVAQESNILDWTETLHKVSTSQCHIHFMQDIYNFLPFISGNVGQKNNMS